MLKKIIATILALSLLVAVTYDNQPESTDGATTTVVELTAVDTLNHFTISINDNDFLSKGEVQLDPYTVGDDVMFRIYIWPDESGEYHTITLYYYVEPLSDGAYVEDVMWSPDSKSDDMNWYDISTFKGMTVTIEDTRVIYWISLKFMADGDYRMVAYALDEDGELTLSSNYRYIKVEDGEQTVRYSNSEVAEMGYSIYLDTVLPHELEAQKTVTVDGDETTVQEGDVYTLPEQDDENAVGYLDSDGNLVKAGAEYTVTDDVEFNTVTLSMTTTTGASILIDSDLDKDYAGGIRFQSNTTVNNADLIENSSAVTTGMLLSTASNYDNTGELTIETDNVIDVRNSEEVYAEDDGTYSFATMITNISSEYYASEYIATTYAILSYSDGTTETIYADSTSGVRSVSDVAARIQAQSEYYESLTAAQQELVDYFAEFTL